MIHVKIYPSRSPKIAAVDSILIDGQELPVLNYEKKPWMFPRVECHKQIVISRKTHPIKTPFPSWEWQDGEIIKDTKENYTSLLEAYRQEYVIHQKQDLKALKDSARKLSETQMIVNYYDDLDQAYEMLNLEESWKSKEQELFEFIEGVSDPENMG